MREKHRKITISFYDEKVKMIWMNQIFDFISQLRYTQIKCQSMVFAKLDVDSGTQWYLATLVIFSI